MKYNELQQMSAEELERHFRRQNQAQEQQSQWPPQQLTGIERHALQPMRQPPGYSPLSEEDVRRIADAVVMRLHCEEHEYAGDALGLAVRCKKCGALPPR